MPAWSPLEIAVLAAALVGVVGLAAAVRRSLAFGCRDLFAKPAGDAQRGVFFLFGPGMLPKHKESARRHAGVYAAGVLYHAGVFLALALLFAGLFRIALPGFARQAAWWLVLAALAAGLGLLVKRILTPLTRRLSTPDDFLANLLVDLFLAGRLATAWDPRFQTAADLAAVALFLYAPVGKIRHCFFFFLSRSFLGAFFGRRGIFPPRGEGSGPRPDSTPSVEAAREP